MKRIQMLGATLGDFDVVGLATCQRKGAVVWTCRCRYCGLIKERSGTDLRRWISAGSKRLFGALGCCGCRPLTTDEAPLGTRWLPLTRGMRTLIDEADYALVSGFNWHVVIRTEGYPYAARNEQRDGGKTIYLHRVLLGAVHGVTVDHVNHDTLDNRRQNLRPASRSEQMRNRALNQNNVSGSKGVHLSKGKWVARIGFGERRYLGRFGSLVEATAAYDNVAKELFGEFALTNQQLRSKEVR